MATRKSEWLASIKPILDREEVKNDAKALAKELSDILEVKVTDADSLEQLTKEFNKQLVNMGKQQIVFSEKTLQGIVSQFANAIAEGLTVGFNAGFGQVETKNIGNNLGKSIGDGVAQGIVSGVKDGISSASYDIIAQLNDLQKRKNELHEQSVNLDKKLSKYERLSEISTMEYDEFKPLSLDGNIDEQAQRIMGEFIDAEDALNEVTSGTKEYNAALIKALQAAEKLYRMSRTINDNKDLVKDKTLLSDFEFTNLSDTTADIFEKADTDFNKILRNFYKYYGNQIKNIKVELGQIDEQMQAIQQNKVEIIDQEKSKSTLKTLKEIEDAQKRIEQKNKRSGGKTIPGYSSAIEYEPGSESLQFLRNRYEGSSNEDWESQYRWLIKFVKEYENYSKQIESETDKIKQKNMRARQKQYASLYEDLKPMAENAENSLRQVLNMQKIEAPSDIAGGSGTTPEDVTNAEKIAEAERLAREEAEKKAKAEKEAEEFAKQKRIEEEKAAKAAEKKRIEEEAAAVAASKAAKEAERERLAKEAATSADSAVETKEPTGAVGSYSDDDSETIAKENGALEDKLELLRDIADQYAANITQKQRDRYEELNQKDMDSGLTPKEEERYYELGEQIDEADSALEEFGQTYDKIILKLENGKKVEILPDDKGLRSLYKFADEYSETYGGIEIEDVIFERVKQEAHAHQENTTAIKNETKAQEELNNVNIQAADDNNSKKIQSYEELNSILKEYLDLEKQKKKFEHTDEDWEWDSISDRYSSLNSLEQTKDDFDTQWKRVLNIKNAIKNGYDSYLDPETKSSERLQENTLEEETKRLKAIALAYADNTEANLDLLNKTQRKFVDDVVNARNVWQEDLERRMIPYNEHNDPIEKRQYEIESIIIDSTSLDNMTGILDSFNQAKSIGQFDSDAVETFAKYLGIELPQAAQTAGKAIDGLNNNLEETRNTAKMPDTQIGTGDASSADVDVAKAEAEKQRLEKERIEAEKIAIQQENEAKLKAEADAKAKLQADLTSANQQLTDAQEAKALADVNARKAEDESRVKDGIIQGLREQLAQVQSGEGGAKASIGVEELKNVLSAITYNVKVVQDADNTDSKVAIDEASLEATLNKVFANILNPQTRQNDGEPDNAPWALESTLQTVKGVLDNIQTNTAKIGTEPQQATISDVGNVLATENTLAAIKTAVESINTKVVKGTKAQTSGGSSKKTGVGKKNAESYAGSQYFPEKIKTQTMYLAKFRAQLMSTGKLTDDIDAQIYQLLDGLKQIKNGPDFSKWNQQFLQLKTSVGITDIFEGAEDKEVAASYKEIIELQKMRNKLELEYEKAEDGSALKQFYAEQLAQMDNTIAKQQTILDNEEYEAKLAKMRAEQARKLGELEAKAADKDAKKKAANDKKMAQKQAMVGKAGNAIGRAENVWLGAQDTDEPLPPELNKRIDELYNKLVTLREKQNEVNQAPMATPEQQKELRNQTVEVNSLTNEVGELLSEYQRLSGDNATVIGKSALGADAGLGAYEQQLKQAVKAATNGKAQIKSFDATTKTLTYTVKTGKNEFTEYTAAVRRADGALVSVQGATKRTETFFEATARKMRELTSYFSGMAIFSRIGQELRRGIQYVREIDLALTELKKVTDETEETYDKFLQTAAKTADKVGSTIQKVVSSTADWARLGSILANTNIRPII